MKKKNEGKGTEELIAGAGLGLIAVGGVAVGAVACPACVVGAPLLIGYGLYQRLKKSKSELNPPL